MRNGDEKGESLLKRTVTLQIDFIQMGVDSWNSTDVHSKYYERRIIRGLAFGRTHAREGPRRRETRAR